MSTPMQPLSPTAADISTKGDIETNEYANAPTNKYEEIIVDTDAAGWTDPTVVIDAAENRRLRNMLLKR